jgi:xylan 1,4-beta-xylosidase
VLLQNHDFQYRFECGMNGEGQTVVRVICREDGRETELGYRVIDVAKIYLKLEASGQSLHFYVGKEPEMWETIVEKADGTVLSADKAGGFIGTYIGLFASGNGSKSSNYADFDYFEYVGQ